MHCDFQKPKSDFTFCCRLAFRKIGQHNLSQGDKNIQLIMNEYTVDYE